MCVCVFTSALLPLFTAFIAFIIITYLLWAFLSEIKLDCLVVICEFLCNMRRIFIANVMSFLYISLYMCVISAVVCSRCR